MFNSMTGFGSGEVHVGDAGKVSVELRSTNHKFLETLIHLPVGFLSLEERIKKEIESRLKRGRVVCSINITGGQQGKVCVNQELVNSYMLTLKNIKNKFKFRDGPSIDTLVNLPGVISLAEAGLPKEKVWPYLRQALSRSLEELVRSRQKEGKALYLHLKREAKGIKSNLEHIQKRFRKIVVVKSRQINNEEERAAFLKSADITEELERLNYHIGSFFKKIHKSGPVGKEIDFIAQEMQREANTMGAKCCDTMISGRVILLKSRIEKIREQAQNAE